MAERAIREFDAKRILSKNWQTYLALSSLLCKPLFSFFNSIIIDIYQLYPHNRLKVALKY